MTIQCPRCRTATPPGARFCHECAAPLEARCASCGAPLAPAAKFCSACAHPVAAAAAAPAPRDYTPGHLADRILTSKAALEGERKQVTVLFADLKGSMELLAERDPEDARALLDPVLQLMMDAVHRFEGTVNQVMGDGIMALFGAPLAHEDHAVRACYAALGMQEAAARYSERARREHGITVRIRVGLNSGEVVVRAIGSDLHMDYTAVGQTTHLAARMEQLADPGATLLTAGTLALAEGFVEVSALGPVAVKGLAQPVEAYQLTGASAARSRLQAAAARGLSRFVGRDAEIAELDRALDQARHGHGQIVAVVGEPGVGKSRLVFELTHSHRTAGWLVVAAGAVPYGKATSYQPLLGLLKGYFRIGDRDSPREIREKVTGKVLTLDRTLESALPALHGLMEVGDDPGWQALDPSQRRQRMLDSIRALLLREAQLQPVVAVFEDLHWIDSETQAFLDALVESIPAARLLLLVNYRPEYEHRWGGKTAYRQLRLDPLPAQSAVALLDGLLGQDATVGPLKPLLIERTEGNPFFLEESVRMLVETRALQGAPGAYRLATTLPGIQVPATVQAILAARIDRLSPEDKRLLQSAAVVGKDVPLTLLAAIADVSDDALRRGLARLQSAEFLYETRLFPDAEYTFKHALTHEVAYQSVLRERRRELHARMVAAIERLHADLLAEHVERLVDHAARGEQWEKAALYGTRAGIRAGDRSAPPQVQKAYFETAIDAFGRLPQTPDTVAHTIEVRCLIGAALFSLNERDAFAQHMEIARSLAERLGNEERLVRVLANQTNALWFSGELPRARETGERALALAQSKGLREHRIHAGVNLGIVLQSAGDARKAIDLFAGVISLLQGDLERQRLGRTLYPASFARNELAACRAELGDFDGAFETVHEAIRLAESIDHPPTVLAARLGQGLILARRGHYPSAIATVEAALEGMRAAAGLAAMSLAAGAVLAHCHCALGRADEGIPLLRHALDRIDAGGRRSDETRMHVFIAEGYMVHGAATTAQHHIARGLELARQRGERGNETRALLLLGELESVDAHLVAASSIAQELGLRPLLARAELARGVLARRQGRTEAAQQHLSTAHAMLREMDMRHWLSQAEAELATLDSEATRPRSS